MQFTYPLRVWCQTGPFRERWGLLALGQCDRRAPGCGTACQRSRALTERESSGTVLISRSSPTRTKPTWELGHPGTFLQMSNAFAVIPNPVLALAAQRYWAEQGLTGFADPYRRFRDAERTAGRRPHTSGGAGAPGVSPAHTHQPLGACPRRAVGKGRGRVPRRGAAAPRTCRPSRARRLQVDDILSALEACALRSTKCCRCGRRDVALGYQQRAQTPRFRPIRCPGLKQLVGERGRVD